MYFKNKKNIFQYFNAFLEIPKINYSKHYA